MDGLKASYGKLLVLGVLATTGGACRRDGADGSPVRPTLELPRNPAPLSPPTEHRGAAAPSPSGAPLSVDSTKTLPDVSTEWCLDGLRGLDEGTCYLVPERFATTRSKTLLVYLSGIVPPTPRSAQKENVQRIVISASKRAGFAVLLPRGRRGIGPATARDWWAWPTTAADYDRHALTMVAEWAAARARLEDAIGGFDRVYLAGSSSGAYFLTALAFAGAVEMDGYAALSGGAAGTGPARARTIAKRPFYVGYAIGDPTNAGPKALGTSLVAAGWPVRVAEHPGGHGAREAYLDEAFAFWASTQRDADHRAPH